ncbi:bifunctional methylenetetrahydrofolate dehydrogenase/methenyltetrahydrofolate cyclohydrolase FolD [Novosphingobium rosa]|uniref:bifunctional methylenetetrahydrofolate dehydrogenase/methenyltetrahydrofolate cyclohydrolase FolD n=1 Tax=Novosphingobium rosa TaxID=76978 RepID=UPI00083191C5|nr:bifunctional methylenetetrahydrofolate dehydrogenase/methenyltetrahydrofolate cyclohydrolase FolD [Novosphingobium rosa]
MSAHIIDGRAIARSIREDCGARVRKLESEAGITPGLAVILVGSDPASSVYVRNKIEACRKAGIQSRTFDLAESISQDELLALIVELNACDDTHGILVQLPLPAGIDVATVLETIAPHKDVDGFHLYNLGALVSGRTVFAPCTPYGIMKLLEHEEIEVEGQNVVMIGASNIVGKPMAAMLTARHATVSICHAKTRNLAQFTAMADVLIVAAGVPDLINGGMIKPGAIVIDVGINRLPDGRIVGDVSFESVRARASRVTPVPGGVGPMTVAMLLVNTVEAAEKSAARQRDLVIDARVED